MNLHQQIVRAIVATPNFRVVTIYAYEGAYEIDIDGAQHIIHSNEVLDSKALRSITNDLQKRTKRKLGYVADGGGGSPKIHEVFYDGYV